MPAHCEVAGVTVAEECGERRKRRCFCVCSRDNMAASATQSPLPDVSLAASLCLIPGACKREIFPLGIVGADAWLISCQRQLLPGEIVQGKGARILVQEPHAARFKRSPLAR